MAFEIDKDFALLYGIMLGDGCLSQFRRSDKNSYRKMIVITGSSLDDLPFFRDVVNPIFFKIRGKETKIKFKRNCNAIEIQVTDEKLFDFIVSLGFPIGKKGSDIFIPQIFYENHLVEQIISGFFATDGSLVLTKNPNKYYPRLEAHAICNRLLKQIYEYLKTKGLQGNGFYECRRQKVNGGFNEVFKKYRFQFNGIKNLILFNKLIGFSNPKYNYKFEQFMKYSEEYSSKAVSTKLVKSVSSEVNGRFERLMATPGVEPGTSAS